MAGSPAVSSAVSGIDPCTEDIVGTLRRYTSGLEAFLAPPETAPRSMSRHDAAEVEVETRKVREDAQRVEDAQREYAKAVAYEQRRWLARDAEMAKSRSAVRRDELEAVKTHFLDSGVAVLEASLEERCNMHIAMLEASELHEHVETHALSAAARARQDWTNEACKMVVLEMRKEWRQGQRRVLQQLSHELRAERKAAAEALERQITMSQRAVEAVRASWVGEIQQAKDDLERVSEAYKNALRTALEHKLREARQHAREQAEYFQREIREALAAEQANCAQHSSQLRRMRLAMLKWRHDYMKDAKRKAEDLTSHRILARVETLGTVAQGGHLVQGNGEDEHAVSEKEQHGETPMHDNTMNNTALSEGEMSHGEPDTDLRDSRTVLEKIWGRFPVEEEEVREFLLRLEDMMPYCEEVLRLYENHLAEHGVLTALDIADTSVDGPISSELLGLGETNLPRRH